MMKNLIVILFLFGFFACNQKTETVSQVADNKNYVVENMLARRSIRSYKPEQIKPEQLDTIITCAVNAPSARNHQPWEVRIIQKPELLSKINLCFNEYTSKSDPSNENVKKEGYSIFYNAPTLVVIAKDVNNPYAEFDCGLLAQNILLSAKSMGIGSVCLGYLSRYLLEDDAKDIVSELNIPNTHKIQIVISLGYPNESPDSKPRDKGKVQVIG